MARHHQLVLKSLECAPPSTGLCRLIALVPACVLFLYTSITCQCIEPMNLGEDDGPL